MEQVQDWKKSTQRFVAFFDIMGFKDLVQRNSHDTVLKKLQILKTMLRFLENVTPEDNIELRKLNTDKFQTRSITFSDSIVIFSKGNDLKDLQKIVADCYSLLNRAIVNRIGIKGALSYGHITVDFENHLFFGQPIIDAYLLHEELLLYNVVLDNNFENKLNSTKTSQNFPDSIIVKYKTPLKSGKVTHQILRPFGSNSVFEQIKSLEQLYLTVSGKPRIYIDNTLDFLRSLSSEEHRKE